MINRFSRYFQRNFGMFMSKLHSKQILEKPTLQNSDIESFFIHVTELKARIDELELNIAIHAFEGRRTPHPQNEELLNRCRISVSDAYHSFGEYIKQRDENRERNMQMFCKV